MAVRQLNIFIHAFLEFYCFSDTKTVGRVHAESVALIGKEVNK